MLLVVRSVSVTYSLRTTLRPVDPWRAAGGTDARAAGPSLKVQYEIGLR